MSAMTAEHTAEVTSPGSEWMSVREVADYAGRHEVTVRKALLEYQHSHGKRGLKGHQRKPHASYRIRRSDVDRWIEGLPPARGSKKRVSAA